MTTRTDAWHLFAVRLAVILAAAGVYNVVRTVGPPVVAAAERFGSGL